MTMAKTNFKSVDQYIDSQPEGVRGALERVRGAIRKALPKAEEIISYKIPAYKLHDRVVLYFAGWKEHYSLYPAGEHIAAVLKEEGVPCEMSKGTIRFPLSEPVPVKLIQRIAKLRAQEAAVRQKAKAAVQKKGPGKRP